MEVRQSLYSDDEGRYSENPFFARHTEIITFCLYESVRAAHEYLLCIFCVVVLCFPSRVCMATGLHSYTSMALHTELGRG